MSTGIPFQLSILYVELLDEFEASNAETSLVQAVCTGTFFGGGFLSGIIVTRYGTQVAGTISGLIAATGLCLSFLATNIPFLVITLGATTGFGFCLTYVCSSTCVGLHFVGRGKLLAMSFVSFGSGIGAMSFSYILEILIQMYGWRGTLLILGGMTLNFIPAALLCVPVKNKPEPETRNSSLSDMSSTGNNPGSMSNIGFEKEESNSFDERKNINKSNTFIETNHEQMNTNQPISEHRIENKPIRSNEVSYRTNGNEQNTMSLKHDFGVRKNAKSTWKGIKTVLQNRIFLLYLLGMTFSLSAFNSILIFLIDFYQSKGLDRSNSVFVLFILNTVGAGGRFVPGLLKTIPHISITTVSAMCCASGCVSVAVLPFVRSYSQLIIVSCFYGLALGGAVTTGSLGTLKLVGIRYYSTGLGMLLSFCSVGVITAGPISGKLRDISGSYDISLYTTASSLGFASIIFALTSLLKTRSRKGREEIRMDIMVNRRMSRRRSSVLPWRRSLEFVY
ncbi:hypothetical protein KUTeg_010802 [Tegillarca granosa]|uniref:Major facilitator superfamily (MFS) profile domain-containing protein n=1 Tax=Tegillarca granosa TaxID=220873 RepID=A0ABQ9F580_TEGGR|nr:hypothetical protein KUTeg_010802 [Tegillarca granosa]